jgi:hypothetical protein
MMIGDQQFHDHTSLVEIGDCNLISGNAQGVSQAVFQDSNERISLFAERSEIKSKESDGGIDLGQDSWS